MDIKAEHIKEERYNKNIHDLKKYQCCISVSIWTLLLFYHYFIFILLLFLDISELVSTSLERTFLTGLLMRIRYKEYQYQMLKYKSNN